MSMGLFNGKSKEPIVAIYVTDCERRIIYESLTRLRDDQIREKKNYDFIEVIRNKVALATEVKEKNKKHEATR